MAEPGSSGNDGSLRELGEELVVAALAAAAAGSRRLEAVLERVGERSGVRPEDVRDAMRELGSRWYGESVRASERASATLTTLFRELGVATREDLDELELRVAQLEHRVRLLERRPAPPDQ